MLSTVANEFNLCHSSRKSPKSFTFDFCFDSIDARSNQFVDQETVFKCVGEDILDNAFQGYNACVFAYGQTGKESRFNLLAKKVRIVDGYSI